MDFSSYRQTNRRKSIISCTLTEIIQVKATHQKHVHVQWNVLSMEIISVENTFY